ncbi:hypothetical protein A1Q1_03514 [Phaffia rhodozyma]|uniref:C2H2-type domain-containing protein n=1 Tax=Phaffia rhodozyma TaxID=264483 RepID=A0A0F7SUA7_PHARH|nr:hypothetical protein A1Q1_03514 [Phaffia rhodozyma]
MASVNTYNEQLYLQQASQCPSQNSSGPLFAQPQYTSPIQSQLMAQSQQYSRPEIQSPPFGPPSTAQAVAAIAAYLNGQASIVYETNRTAQYYRSVAAVSEDSTLLTSIGSLQNQSDEIVMIQAKAIEALLNRTSNGNGLGQDTFPGVSSAFVAQPPQQHLWQGAPLQSWPSGSQVIGSRKHSIQSDGSGSAFSPTSNSVLAQSAYASPPVLMDDHGSSASSSSASSFIGSPLMSQMGLQTTYPLTDLDIKSFSGLTYECNDLDLYGLDVFGMENTVQPSSSLLASAIAPDVREAWASYPQTYHLPIEPLGADGGSPATSASTPYAVLSPSVSDNTKNSATRVVREMIPWNIEVTAQDPKKRHVCIICKRGFARAFNLKSHMLTHDPSRPKPFACSHKGCGRSFSRAHDLDRHRQGIHSEGPLVSKYVKGPTSVMVDPMAASKAKKRSARGVSSA